MPSARGQLLRERLFDYFSAIFTIGNNLWEFLFDSLNKKSFPKWGQLLQKMSQEKQILPFESWLHHRERKQNWYISFPWNCTCSSWNHNYLVIWLGFPLFRMTANNQSYEILLYTNFTHSKHPKEDRSRFFILFSKEKKTLPYNWRNRVGHKEKGDKYCHAQVISCLDVLYTLINSYLEIHKWVIGKPYRPWSDTT